MRSFLARGRKARSERSGFGKAVREVSRAIVERLEPRQLLTGVSVGGTVAADALRLDLSADGQQLRIWRDGTNVGTYARSTVDYVSIDALDGDDSVTVDFGNDPSCSVNLFYIGGAGSDALTVEAGTVTLCTDPGIETDVLGAVTLNNTARLVLADGLYRAVTLDSLYIAPAAMFDIADNALILRHSDTDYGIGKMNLVAGYLRSSLQAETPWSGPGLASSAAANDPNWITGIAAVNNNDGFGNAMFTRFCAQEVDQNAILIKYTYWADADLNGPVEQRDFTLTDIGWYNHLGAWFYGDFNYDGSVTADDYAMLTGSWFSQAPAPTFTIDAPWTQAEGATYTLNLAATTVAPETIDYWTLYWGDGTVQVVDGTGGPVTHSYGANTDGSPFALDVFAKGNTITYQAAEESVVVKPNAPDGLGAVAQSGHRIDLSWVDHSGTESGFEIQQSLTGEDDWATVATVGANVTSVSLSGPFAPATTYYFRVRAVTDVADSEWAASASVTTGTFPAAPVDLTATPASTSSIALEWTAYAGTASGLAIERSADGSTWTRITTRAVTDTTFTDTGLSEGTHCFYRLFAYTDINAPGTHSGYSLADTATVPAAPSGLTAVAVSANRVELNWADNSQGETGFEIEQSTDGVEWTWIGWTFAEEAHHYNAEGPFAANTAYYFRVRASNDYASSAYAATASVTLGSVLPAVSSFAVGSVTGSSIGLVWSPYTGTSRIERSEDGINWYVRANPALADGSYTDTGLTAGSSYYYRICATSGSAESAYAYVSGATTPAAPVFGVVGASASTLDVVWRANIGSSYLSYTLYYGTTASPTDVAVSDYDGLQFTIEGMTPQTAYYLRLAATDQHGNSAQATLQTSTLAAPLAPGSLSATAVTCDSITLAWGSSGSVDGYELQMSEDGGTTYMSVAVVDPEIRTYTVAWLNPSTAYQFRVQALRFDAPSSWTGPIVVTTAPGVPGVPESLTATAISEHQVNLAWTVPPGNPQSGFTVWQSTDGVNFTAVASNLGAETRSYAVSGLADGTEYFFRMTASNAAGESDYSIEAWAVTPLAQASNLQFAQVGEGIWLGWVDESASERGYVIQVAAVDANGVQSLPSTLITPPGVTEYVVTSAELDALAIAPRYAFRVQAFNAHGRSAEASAPMLTVDRPDAPPVAASNVVCERYPGGIAVGWSYSGQTPDSFEVQWSTDPMFQTDVASSVDYDPLGIGGWIGGSSRGWARGNATFSDEDATTTYVRVVTHKTQYEWVNGERMSVYETAASDYLDIGMPVPIGSFIDLDADTNNDGACNRGAIEDGMEIAGYGLILQKNDGDANGDGTLDLDDNGWSARFSPLVLDVSEVAGLSGSDTWTIEYDAQKVRVWTKDGTQVRNRSSIASEGNGDLVPPGTYSISELINHALPETGDNEGARVLYLEAIGGTAAGGGQSVIVSVTHGGSTYTDAVAYTVIDLQMSVARTGEYFGQELPETAETPNGSRMLILVNNDADAQPGTGAKDYDDDLAAVPVGSTVPDHDLMKITLKQVPSVLHDGVVRLRWSSGGSQYVGSVRLFDSAGVQIFRGGEANNPDLAVNLGNPQGPLAGLVSGDVTLWAEGLEVDGGLSLSLEYYSASGGATSGRDEVDVRIARYSIVGYTGLEGGIGPEIDMVPTVPMQQLLDLANGVSGTAAVPDEAKFKIQIEGILPSDISELKVVSGSVASDYYLDTAHSLWTDRWVSANYAVIYQASDTEVLTGGEDGQRAQILSVLGLNAVHNAVAPNVSISSRGDKQTAEGPPLAPRLGLSMHYWVVGIPERELQGGKEKTPGGYMPLNDDEDVEEGTPDWTLPQSKKYGPALDDDMLKLVLHAATREGLYRVKFGSKLRVWQDPGNGPLRQVFSYGDKKPTEFEAKVDSVLYVEAVGTQISTDNRVELYWLKPGATEWQQSDWVNINVFRFTGLYNLPQASVAKYTVMGGPVDGHWLESDAFIGSQDVETNEQNPQEANVFWGAGPYVAIIAYAAAPGYEWDRRVYLVKVTVDGVVDPVKGQAQFALRGSEIQVMPRMKSRPYRRRLPGGGEQTIAWNYTIKFDAKVSVAGPVLGNGEVRGVRYLEIGFIQNIRIYAQYATYLNGSERTSQMHQQAYLDKIRDYHSSEHTPWYDRAGLDATWLPKGNAQTSLSTSDGPFFNIPARCGPADISEACLKAGFDTHIGVRVSSKGPFPGKIGTPEDTGDLYVSVAQACWNYDYGMRVRPQVNPPGPPQYVPTANPNATNAYLDPVSYGGPPLPSPDMSFMVRPITARPPSMITDGTVANDILKAEGSNWPRVPYW